MKLGKVLTGIAAFVLGLALTTGVASASPSGPVGPVAVAEDEIQVKVHNFNFGFVYNGVLTGANTGLNKTDKGNSGTGGATASTAVSNGLNSSSTGVAVYDFEVGPVAVNYLEEGPVFDSTIHGPSGHPVAIAKDSTEVDICNFNLGMVLNLVATSANTGKNTTKKGDSDTGDAYAGASVSTSLNSNNTSVTVVEGGLGPVAVNWQPEEHSLALAEESTSVEVKNKNMGMVANKVYTGANTGRNETNGGSSSTGNATAGTTVGNTVNTNVTNVTVNDSGSGPVAANVAGVPGDTDCLTNGCGDMSVGPVAVNVGTSGVAVAEDETKVEVSNTNAGAVVNKTATVANTGNNETNGESKPKDETTATSSTGNATASTTVTNTVNSNSTTVVIGGQP